MSIHGAHQTANSNSVEFLFFRCADYILMNELNCSAVITARLTGVTAIFLSVFMFTYSSVASRFVVLSCWHKMEMSKKFRSSDFKASVVKYVITQIELEVHWRDAPVCSSRQLYILTWRLCLLEITSTLTFKRDVLLFFLMVTTKTVSGSFLTLTFLELTNYSFAVFLSATWFLLYINDLSEIMSNEGNINLRL